MTAEYDKETQTFITWIEDKKKYLEEHGHDEVIAERKFRRRVESSSMNFGKVRDKLRDFLQRRESQDIVIGRGIMKTRQVFGAGLEEVVSRESIGDGVPLFVRRCISAIEAPNRINREGIYRINGNAAQIQKLRLIVDDHADYNLHEARWDVHTLTGTFKLFFREMHSPLLSDEFYINMKNLIVNQNLKGQNLAKRMKSFVGLIQGTRLATLKALIAHLLNVLKADNRMTAENLALVFGPNIMWYRDKDEQFDAWSMDKVMIPTQVLQLFLKYPNLLEEAESED